MGDSATRRSKDAARDALEDRLHDLGWSSDDLHRELCARLPKSISDFPCINDAVDSILDEMANDEPEFFEHFKSRIEIRLKAAANDQCLTIRGRITEFLRHIQKEWPIVRHHAEDIAQQVFEALYTMPKSSWFDTSRSNNWSGWLYAVTSHQAFDYLRKQGLRKRGPSTLSIQDVAEPAAVGKRAHPTRSQLLLRLADECGDGNALLFIMTHLDAFPVKKAAANLGYSVYSVYKKNGTTQGRMVDLGREYFDSIE